MRRLRCVVVVAAVLIGVMHIAGPAHAADTWTQQGAAIDGTATFENSGWSVAMSDDGMTLAIGSPGNSGVASGAGQVRVFTCSGTAWTRQGSNIDGEGPSDQFEYSVAMSSDGTTIVIGAPLSDVSASNAGQVRVFTWPYAEVSTGVPGPPTTFTFLLPDGRECSAISPMQVQVGTMVELPGVDALCQKMPGSTVAGWTIPVSHGFTGYGSSFEPFPPGVRVRVVESQRFTLVSYEPVIQIDYDANIAADDSCTITDVAHGSDDGRIEHVWLPRADFAMARTSAQAPCVPDGYRLTGWNTGGDGSGETIDLGAELPGSWESQAVNHHRLYAVWSWSS